MKKLSVILAAFAIPIFWANILFSKTPEYKDFSLGDSRKNVTAILKKQKYSQYTIFYDSNDRYINGIKVKSENSIKIVISRYMEKEEILLVFDNKGILFDIYSKKFPMDVRDYIDYRMSFTEAFGAPSEDQEVNGRHVLAWSLNKKRNAVYIIYDAASGNLIVNIRDLYLNAKYEPAYKE